MLIMFVWACIPCRDISSIHNLHDLEQSCSFPKKRSAMWSCSVPPPMERTPKNLYALHKACSLDTMVDAQYFALNTGNAIRAAQIYFWLSSKGHPNASQLSTLALGKRIIPQNTPLSTISLTRRTPVDLEDFSIFPSQVTEDGEWGRYPYWQLPEKNHNLIAIDPNATIQDIRFALASRENTSEPLEILVLSEDLTSIPIHSPTSSHPEIIEKDEHGWHAKTELEYARVDFNDQDPIQHLIEFITEHPNKTVELTMRSTPCAKKAYPNMHCYSAHNDQSTYYMDITSVKDFAACVDAGACTADKGTWFAAVQLCRFHGKRLPTQKESITLHEEQWSMDIGDAAHHRYTTSNRSLPVEAILPSSPHCVTTLRPNKIKNTTTPWFDIEKDTLQRVHQRIQEESIPSSSVTPPVWDNLNMQSMTTTDTSFFEHLGGAYLGYADGLNFQHIAYSRPSWAIIWGENRKNLHRMIIVSMIIQHTQTAADMTDTLRNIQHIEKKIQEREAKKKYTPLMDIWKKEKSQILSSLRALTASTQRVWINDEEAFQHLKQLITDNQLFIISGQWSGKKTLSSIGEVFSDIDVPIRMLYLGTVTDSWRIPMSNRQQKNLLSLSFDDQSRVFHKRNRQTIIMDGLTFTQRVRTIPTKIWWDIIPSTIPKTFITGVVSQQNK